MSEQKIKLFLSFSWLFNKLSRNLNAYTKEELQNSLYSFGCARSGAMDGDFVLNNLVFSKDSTPAIKAYDTLFPILNELELQGKVQFRKDPVTLREFTIEQYNEFLVKHNLNPIPRFEDEDHNYYLNLPRLSEATELANPNVEVIWRG